MLECLECNLSYRHDALFSALSEDPHRFAECIDIGDVQSSLVRISGLVGAVKDYSFMDQEPVQEIDLHEGLETTLTMLGYRMEHVTVVKDFDRSLPKFCAHGSALNQIWTNLIENALDAMPGGGELRLRTSRELDCALIEIGDNGHGIPELVRERLFEPFVSQGKENGTGLGLTVVQKIVQDHGGDVRVESTSSEGTVFLIVLPGTRGTPIASATGDGVVRAGVRVETAD